MESQIFDNVSLGEGTIVHPPSILGFAPRGAEPGELPLVIGESGVIRPFTTIYAGTTIGKGFQTGHGATIREDNIIGDNCSVGSNTVLEYGNRLGNNVRIHSQCLLENVTLGEHVILGPGIMFTDDPHHPCPRYQDCKGGVVLEDLVRVGANVTFTPGVRVGRNSLVGAGAVVTRDIPPNVVAAGSPARVIKPIDELTCWPGFFERPYIWEPYGPQALPED